MNFEKEVLEHDKSCSTSNAK